MRRRCPLALVALLSPILASAAAASFQPVDSIRDAAQAVAGEATVAVDAGLRMPACERPLAAAVANARNVQVRCADTPGWQIYVPLRANAGAATVGRRLPMAGAVSPAVETAAPEAAFNVQRGDPVVLVSRAGGIEVRMGGRALGPANAAGQVNVENSGSRRIIRGRLVAAGVVEVAL